MNPTDSVPAEDGTDTSQCWCCGSSRRTEEMVSLGDHPEVTLCWDCARWAHRRAVAQADALSPGVGSAIRSRIQAVRDRVIALELHQRPRLGPILRRIDRWLP